MLAARFLTYGRPSGIRSLEVGPLTATGRGHVARRVAPLLAVATILVHLGGTVGAYLHFAVVAHERCPEHGELVHEAPGHNSAAPRAPHAGDGPSYEQGGGATEDSHDLCTLTAALTQRAIESAPAVGVRAQPPRSLQAPRARTVPLAGARAGYRVAPKTSPPHRA